MKQDRGMNIDSCDVLIAGTGVAGLCCALNLPRSWRVVMLTKSEADKSDSFLAQGGICMLRGQDDFAGYFEDTMRAGHYENDEAAVRQMILRSPAMIDELIGCGVLFARDKEGGFRFTREGGHSRPRILFHDDVTGKEITSKLLAKVRQLPNVEICEHAELLDIIVSEGACRGGVVRGEDGSLCAVYAGYTLFATGGVGGLFEHSTNYRHLTGDALAIAMRRGVVVEHLDYVQIHPTTFYSEKHGRRFLISESVRGEGAVLLDKHGNRFCNELLPRDIVTGEIRAQMEKDGTKFVWLDMRPVGAQTLREHFPTICARLWEEGYDVLKQPIPVVPAQHYFMGGVKVDLNGRTSMPRLYAAGETACNGVHGKNRLASNSLLESLIWAELAAKDMAASGRQPVREGALSDAAAGDAQIDAAAGGAQIDAAAYADYAALKQNYADIIRQEAEREATID